MIAARQRIARGLRALSDRISSAPPCLVQAHVELASTPAADEAAADVDNIRTVFKGMDVNGDGTLDISEVADFCKKLGLVLNDKETTQALAEMELDASEDGVALGCTA